MIIRYALMSELGGREKNEDCVGNIITDALSGFFVCDGLGGHGKGDVASSIAVESFKTYFESIENIDDSVVDNAYQIANQNILKKQQESNLLNQMKTTAVLLLIRDGYAYISNIGDTRCYVFFEDGGYMRTQDHSVPEMLRLTGKIKDSEIRHHFDRNKLLRALGNQPEAIKCNIIDPIELDKCKAFLLCSDGYWENVVEDRMMNLLSDSSSPDEWLEKMKSVITQNGIYKSMDNFSAIAVWND